MAGSLLDDITINHVNYMIFIWASCMAGYLLLVEGYFIYLYCSIAYGQDRPPGDFNAGDLKKKSEKSAENRRRFRLDHVDASSRNRVERSTKSVKQTDFDAPVKSTLIFHSTASPGLKFFSISSAIFRAHCSKSSTSTGTFICLIFIVIVCDVE